MRPLKLHGRQERSPGESAERQISEDSTENQKPMLKNLQTQSQAQMSVFDQLKRVHDTVHGNVTYFNDNSFRQSIVTDRNRLARSPLVRITTPQKKAAEARSR